MRTRKLTLRAERLAELSAGDLGAVGGASGLPCDVLVSGLLCPSRDCTGYYPSLNAPCDSHHC